MFLEGADLATREWSLGVPLPHFQMVVVHSEETRPSNDLKGETLRETADLRWSPECEQMSTEGQGRAVTPGPAGWHPMWALGSRRGGHIETSGARVNHVVFFQECCRHIRGQDEGYYLGPQGGVYGVSACIYGTVISDQGTLPEECCKELGRR